MLSERQTDKQTSELTGYPSIDRPWIQFYGDNTEFSIPNTNVFDYMIAQNPPCDSIALDFFGNHITYQELLEKIEVVTKALLSAGIQKNDVISICMPTTPEAYYLFFALNRIGAIANFFDPRNNIEFIEKCINDTNSKLLFIIDAVGDKIKNLKVGKSVKDIIYIPISSSFPKFLKIAYNIKSRREYNKLIKRGYKKWSDFLCCKDCPIPKADLNNESIAAIVYTSGTTEIPKGAMLSNGNIIGLVLQNKLSNFGWDRYDKFLEIMPPFIAYGLLCGLVIPICIGMHVIIIPKFERDKFASLILKYKPNHIMGVPSMMEDLAQDAIFDNVSLKFLKTMIVGGDKISVASELMINEFLKTHDSDIKLIKGYGMTEMSSNAVFTKNKECNEPGSVGVPLIGNDIKIIDANTGEECKYGIKGEICLAGPTLIPGYYNNEEETNKVFVIEDNKRWIHSGDIGYITKEGVLYVEGRLKRMIIRHDGFKVIPRLIEDVICKSDRVKNCAVIGVADLQYGQGQLPAAWVVLNESEDIDLDLVEEELAEMCNADLPEYEQPAKYFFASELPLTPIGKIDYKKLEQRALS